MRELFISERRYIENLLQSRLQTSADAIGPVFFEFYAPPRTKSMHRFNNDYFLQFVPQEAIKNLESCVSTILPNTRGADLFLTVEKGTLKPLQTELLSGEAFSIDYFQDYISQIESRLTHRVRIEDCAYSRVFIIDSDICFLTFPKEIAPVMRGQKSILIEETDAKVDCYNDGDELVCIDGWIRTTVEKSEWKLVASYEQE